MTRVSDTALLRFVAQDQGIDVEALRESIAGRIERATRAARALGISTYGIRLDGVFFIVRDATVVTTVGHTTEGGRFRALAMRDQ